MFCPGEGEHDIAAVVCTDTQADLEPDLYQLVTSAYLEDKPLFTLQCAMEENCVAAGNNNQILRSLYPTSTMNVYSVLIIATSHEIGYFSHFRHQIYVKF